MMRILPPGMMQMLVDHEKSEPALLMPAAQIANLESALEHLDRPKTVYKRGQILTSPASLCYIRNKPVMMFLRYLHIDNAYDRALQTAVARNVLMEQMDCMVMFCDETGGIIFALHNSAVLQPYTEDQGRYPDYQHKPRRPAMPTMEPEVQSKKDWETGKEHAKKYMDMMSDADVSGGVFFATLATIVVASCASSPYPAMAMRFLTVTCEGLLAETLQNMKDGDAKPTK